MVDYIPEKWKNLKLEHTDEYLKNKEENQKNQKKQPEKIIVNNPLKFTPESILKNKNDVYNEKHKGNIDCDRCINKTSRCTIL